ncbi:MAG: hypothetical protein Q9186_002114 [Xanthomendoza sp. 1 TL-2023]
MVKISRNPPRQYVVFPQQKNCVVAIRSLPDIPEIGEFHSQPGRDPTFQLPTFQRYKDCEVLIELPPQRTSKTSWLAIGLAATQLSLACVDPNNPVNGWWCDEYRWSQWQRYQNFGQESSWEERGNPGGLDSLRTVGTAIDNLLHSLAAKEDIRFRQAALVSVNLYVNDQFSPYGLDRSRNIRAFRSIVTFFHIGGPEPAPPTRDGICVRNQFPHPWEQWHAPFFVGDIPGRRERGLHALAWEQVWEQMSITRADYLLKRAGYLGKYGQVSLIHLTDRPVGWCFDFYHPLMGQVVSAVNVEVLTGRVVDLGGTLRCTTGGF